VRSLDVAIIERIWQAWLKEIRGADARYRTHTTQASETNAAPAAPPAWLLDGVFAACKALDPKAMRLPSGAGHDTQHLSLVAPSAMIFVPSIGGRSHCPEEATSPEDIALGAQALLNATLALVA
jgi:N-carbamoyl-L-amino-acid hydrolase